MSVFGHITTPPQVEKAVLATLKAHSNGYLREMERVSGRQPFDFPNVVSWRATDDIAERFPEQMIPAVQLALTTDADLTTEADDVIGGFRGTIDVVVQSAEAERARELASLYAYSLGLIILQNPQLDGSVNCRGTGWERIGTPQVGKLKGESRWLSIGTATIICAVAGIASPLMGPEAPIGPDEEATPPADYPVAEHTKLTVTLED